MGVPDVIEDWSGLAEDVVVRADVVVVGSGPAGIVTALETARHGIDVVVLESGLEGYDHETQRLSDAAWWDQHRHTPMGLAVRRQLGGTSTIWGGRCVPYDPVDYAPRPFVGSATWPHGYEEMRLYFQRACDWLVCGRAEFDTSKMPHLPEHLVPGLVDGDVTTSALERWSLPTDFGKEYRGQLRHSPHVRLLTGVTCTDIVCAPETRRAERLRCRTRAGVRIAVEAKAFVVACGGLESTRLLMASTAPEGGRLGNGSGQLGHWYMAHPEGVIANAAFSTPPRSTVYGYERDIDGVYVRRRFAFTTQFQLAQELPNIVGCLANPELADARHGSGPLSFVYLALVSPLGPKFAPDAQRLSLTGTEIPGAPYGAAERTPWSSHLANIAREPLATGRFMVGFGVRRFLARGRRSPGFYVYRKDNVYPLRFHGEHLPRYESRVSLSDGVDAVGRRKLRIDLRFSEGDVDGVVRAHRHWDAYLRSSGVGRLEYLHPDPHEAVRAQLGGGFHQVGTTRMAASPRQGVVDGDLAVHGARNVFVASSSTFVTSSQANSTFMVVAYAVRLADHLCQRLRAPRPSASAGIRPTPAR